MKITASAEQKLLKRIKAKYLWELDWSMSMIAKEVGVAPRTVGYWIQRFKSDDSLSDRPRSGRPRKLDDKLRKRIAQFMEQKNRGPKKVAAMLEEKGVKVSPTTVRRGARTAQLSPKKPIGKPKGRRGTKYARRLFCEEFRDSDWNNFVFGDEATCYSFALPNSKNNVIWTKIGVAPDPLPTVPNPCKINAFGCFSASGIMLLHLFEGNWTSKRYLEMLETKFKPLVKDLDYHWTYLSDKSPVHTGKKVVAWLKANCPEYIGPDKWPGYSPDLNPIENAWAVIKDRVALAQPKNKTALKKAITKAWNEVMTQEFRSKLAESMKARLTACRAANGGPTKY